MRGRRFLWFGGVAAGLFVLMISIARPQELVADLSSHLIAINTGFTGTSVVLFGSLDGPGDVAVVVKGPESDAVVRRKSRVAGIWVNTRSMTFEQVPRFYTVATSRPLNLFVAPPVLARHEIGLDYIRLVPSGDRADEDVTAFRRALVRNKQEEGLYGLSTGEVTFLGERLFRTNVHFPANVPTGLYTVSVFLVRDGDVVTAQTTPLAVSKVGFSATVYEFAQRESVYYGIIAVIGAVAAGWAAGVIFRKT